MIDTTSMGIMASYIQPSSNVMATNMISKKDEDSDSSLSIDELGVDSDIFSSYDSDSDGLVSSTELTSAIDSAMSEFDGSMPSKEQFQSMLADFGFEAPNSTSSSSNSLSTSQQDTISSVLANYDASNLTQSDAKEIVAAFKEAGIQPSAELESAMEEAGFDAKEVGTLAGVGPQDGGQGSGAGGGQGGGGSGGGESASSEEYDEMDTNEDGFVSADEIAEYYGSDDTNELSTNNQNALDNIQILMETLKSNSEDGSVDSNSFDGLLKAINNQNHHSEINTYLQNSETSAKFGYV